MGMKISRKNSFTENFVENYVALAREAIFKLEQRANANTEILMQGMLQSISQIILESDHGEFFLKLVSDLPEKSTLIASESVAEKMKTHSLWGKALALVKCANCKVFEKSEKQFQKCSLCGFVFYCSKACQRND